MNSELWNKIQAFDFDQPLSEYGFSARLAKENFWTRDFTAQAIIEYKKFMYLAATSDMMVSPSGVVDVVWHQHLVFTQSYNDFCTLLGKTIQHIPSTRNKTEIERFRQAKDRSRNLYQSIFGDMPREIWEYSTMYDSLELPKAKWNIRTFILFGILIFIALTAPSYLLLKPLYVNISSFVFLWAFFCLIVLVLVLLDLFNRQYLHKVIVRLHPTVFVFRLQPIEVLYLKSQSSREIIDGALNQLVQDNKLAVVPTHLFEIVKGKQPATPEEYQVMEAVKSQGKATYKFLQDTLIKKPIFANVLSCMDALRKYFIKSRAFGRLFYFNFGVLAFVLMLGFTRLLTGLLRDKPVENITVMLIGFVIVMMIYLARLTSLVGTKTIPKLYREKIIPAGMHVSASQDWQYFLMGSVALAPAFIPVMRQHNSSSSDASSSSSSSDSSSGSSCGSSCSSCGGCGGGGD